MFPTCCSLSSSFPLFLYCHLYSHLYLQNHIHNLINMAPSAMPPQRPGFKRADTSSMGTKRKIICFSGRLPLSLSDSERQPWQTLYTTLENRASWASSRLAPSILLTARVRRIQAPSQQNQKRTIGRSASDQISENPWLMTRLHDLRRQETRHWNH